MEAIMQHLETLYTQKKGLDLQWEQEHLKEGRYTLDMVKIDRKVREVISQIKLVEAAKADQARWTMLGANVTRYPGQSSVPIIYRYGVSRESTPPEPKRKRIAFRYVPLFFRIHTTRDSPQCG